MLGPRRSSVIALGAVMLMELPARAVEPEPAVSSPPVQAEVIPVPREPVDPSRSGRGLLAVGGVLLGLGAAGRLATEGFWVGPAKLEASEPFGQWSIPNIALFTGFSNLFVVPGLVVTGLGARRHGAWRVASGRRSDDLARTRRTRALGWGLLGGGLSLWAVTRALAIPVLHGCTTNGCAYGYLESTFWLSLGTTVTGVALVGLAAGERRAARRFSVVPMLGPQRRGLAVGGSF